MNTFSTCRKALYGTQLLQVMDKYIANAHCVAPVITQNAYCLKQEECPGNILPSTLTHPGISWRQIRWVKITQKTSCDMQSFQTPSMRS